MSLFPGADLFGRGFEAEGWCVVRGPDLLWGGDIRDFAGMAGRFDGIIGGPPCQDFSRARRTPPTGNGVAMLREFARVVLECDPTWFVMENVPCVPDVTELVPEIARRFTVQRLDLDARQCGLVQRRLRHFQAGTRDGTCVVLHRGVTSLRTVTGEPTCHASEGRRPGRRTWADFVTLQGLPADFSLPGLSRAARYQAVGNGVPVPMARVIAQAVTGRLPATAVTVCACGCGRPVTGRASTATPACRKRQQRRREKMAAAGG